VVCLPSACQRAELAKKLPHMQFILDHCGHNAYGFDDFAPRGDLAEWSEAITALAECPNVVCVAAASLAPSLQLAVGVSPRASDVLVVVGAGVRWVR